MATGRICSAGRTRTYNQWINSPAHTVLIEAGSNVHYVPIGSLQWAKTAVGIRSSARWSCVRQEQAHAEVPLVR